ncbi:MAG TPA: hypoxanthine phosphoribosyltransferase [Myxococcota bacterium]|nr:hypoxanthine phosphoribosyltransferase [Myxococcota bacterium]
MATRNSMGDWSRGTEVLFSEDRIQARIAELGAAITRDYAGRELVLVGVLKGCFLFMADLCRKIDLPLKCDFLGLSSYGDHTKSTGVIRITSDLKRPIEGENVLVVEDIVDSGLTMRYLLSNLHTRKPRDIKVCSLLDKPSRRQVDVKIDYLGFSVPDLFVVGYGLDYKGRYRNLPYVGNFTEDPT